MFAFLSPYKLAIEGIVFLCLALGIMWGVHEFLEHEREIGRQEIRVLDQAALQAAKEKAQTLTDQLASAQADAITKGVQREQSLQILAASGATASIGLRDTLEGIRRGVPAATIEALRNSTNALSTVLTDCQGRYRELAEKADRHASDVKTLNDAWPVPAK